MSDPWVSPRAPTAPALIPVSGGTIRVRSLDCGGLRFAELEFPAGLVLAPHYHERACMSIMTHGLLVERLGGREHECAPGGVLVKPAGETHSDRFGRRGSRQIVVEPTDGAADALGLAEVFGATWLKQPASAAALATRMGAELRARDAATALSLQALFLELCAGAVRHGRPGDGASPPRWLRQTAERIREELRPDLTVAELARDVGFHPSHVARCFRAHFGVSIGTYARDARLRWSADRLRASPLSISEIALRAGFADQPHFTRSFRKAFGTTPSRYRAGATGGRGWTEPDGGDARRGP
jgi:AraC family transcriptional regulator